VLDEPELGLHPAAIVVLGGLLRAASARVQVLLATQSVTLLNQFTPDDVIVAERESEATVFRRLSEMDQTSWIDGYALGELWEMNAMGGRP
jgi:predicted ATPase